MNNNHRTNNQRNHKESDVDLPSEPDPRTTASTTTPPTLPGSSAVSTNLNQLRQYLDEDLGDVRDGAWNRDFINEGILPKQQLQFHIESEFGDCDPVTRSILRFCADNGYKKQPSTLEETMRFYRKTPSIPLAAEEEAKGCSEDEAEDPMDESPEIRRKREEKELEEEQGRKKRRIAKAHKLLRIGGSVHGPIEVDADDPPYEVERRIKGEMCRRRMVMRELYHFDLDSTIHPDVVYVVNAVESSTSDPNPGADPTPRPVTPSPADSNMYVVSRSVSKLTYDSLVDRGANGGLAGSDMRLICYDLDRTIDVQGIDNHQVPNLRLGKFGAVAKTKKGNVLLIFSQYAHIQNGKSIHSSLQMEDNNVTVNDRPIRLRGDQSLTTSEGYILPLDFKRGLAYLKIRPYTDDEFIRLPHVYMTRDIPWVPSRYDAAPSYRGRNYDISTQEGFDDVGMLEASYTHHKYRGGSRYTSGDTIPMIPAVLTQLTLQGASLLNRSSDINSHVHHSVNSASRGMGYGESSEITPDWEGRRQFFLNAPAESVRRTYDAATRHYRDVSAPTHIRQLHRSAFPACNVNRRHEAVATDTIFSDVTALGGWTCAQFFVGKQTRYISLYGCKSDGQFVSTLQDEIRLRGAMDEIISDRAQAEISNAVQQVLRAYLIKDRQSEPHKKNQNYAERCYQDVKRYVNWILNTTGAPPETWFLVCKYVAYVMNRTARSVLGWRTPYEALTGQTPDISELTHFTFWEKCLIKNYSKGEAKRFPSQSNELLVHFVGYAEQVGAYATFMVWNPETKSLLYRSEVKKIRTPADVNLRVNPPSDPPQQEPPSNPDDEKPVEPVEFVKGREGDDVVTIGFDPGKMIGRSFLGEPDTDGTLRRRKITELVEDYEGQFEQDPARVRFKSVTDATGVEEIIEYNEICTFIEEQEEREDGTWMWKKILNHRKQKSQHQVLLEWESGERTWEPIREIWRTYSFLLCEYAIEHNLIDLWDSKGIPIKKLSKRNKLMTRMLNQAKRESYKNTPVYMFGFQVPRNHAQAMALDQENKNTKWADSEKAEKDQLIEYETFDDRGHRSMAITPVGYKKITIHFVYAVKHDGRHKSRAVAGGHLTETPTESVYSGVVSLRGVRLIVFLSELNELELWQTDIGNAYLEAKTKEKVYVIAGPEFGEELEGHLLVIVRALYGLKTSGLRWHERFGDVLREMGFLPCPAEPDIWMRDMGDHYEYIATYVDDLTIASKDPEAITNQLEDVHKFKLKGTGKINYLLGCDYYRDKGGCLCMRPKKYIEKMMLTYVRLFGEQPKEYPSPLEPNDNPELDTSELLDLPGIKTFQSMIGSCQWIIQLGRFDIAVHIMSMGSFRTAPRVGHLERMKRIYGYLKRFKTGTIRIRTGIPDFSDLKYEQHDWSRSPYAGATEIVPDDIPEPKGKPVRLYSYADANLYHNKANGRAVTAVLHFINKTPFDWFAKTQKIVNTATFGAESTAARTAVEQMRTHRTTLMYLGVPIIGPSVLFGDNESVVNTTSRPHGKLHKRHLMLSYHYVREALATGEYVYSFVNSKKNASDVLSKHWHHKDVYPNIIKPLLFHGGDTLNLAKERGDQ